MNPDVIREYKPKKKLLYKSEMYEYSSAYEMRKHRDEMTENGFYIVETHEPMFGVGDWCVEYGKNY